MKKTTYHCDIDRCDNTKQVKIDQSMQVIFNTDQTEGRTTKPYFSMEELDICESCCEKILKNGLYIQGSGAQGYNTYKVFVK